MFTALASIYLGGIMSSFALSYNAHESEGQRDTFFDELDLMSTGFAFIWPLEFCKALATLFANATSK